MGVSLILWVHCSAALAAVVYSALLLLDYRRKGRKVWLVKLVKRPSGGYITLKSVQPRHY